MLCTESQAVLLLGAVTLTLLPSTQGVSVPASRDPCPLSTTGLTQFFDSTTGRCSPCSTGVCQTYRSLPEPCICACVTGSPNRGYSDAEKRLCQIQHPPADSALSIRHHDSMIWLSSLAIIAVALAAIAALFYRRRYYRATPTTTATPTAGLEDVPLMPVNNTADQSINRTDDTRPTTTPLRLPALTEATGISTPAPSMTREHVTEDSELTSLGVTSPPDGDVTRAPDQQTHLDTDLDRTPRQNTLENSRGENPTGVPEEGPCTPEECVPCHNPRLKES